MDRPAFLIFSGQAVGGEQSTRSVGNVASQKNLCDLGPLNFRSSRFPSASSQKPQNAISVFFKSPVPCHAFPLGQRRCGSCGPENCGTAAKRTLRPRPFYFRSSSCVLRGIQYASSRPRNFESNAGTVGIEQSLPTPGLGPDVSFFSSFFRGFGLSSAESVVDIFSPSAHGRNARSVSRNQITKRLCGRSNDRRIR